MQPNLTIIAITQDCSHERHQNIFRLAALIVEKLKHKFNVTLHIVADIDLKTHHTEFVGHYNPSLWSNHINEIAVIASANHLAASKKGVYSSNNQWKKVILSMLNTTPTLFPERVLSRAELEIACKHYLALMLSSQLQTMSLIVEDDALPSDRSLAMLEQCLTNIYSSFDSYSSSYFIDMCCYPSIVDLGIPRNILAVTRTLCAYLVSPLSAALLVKHFLPFAIPVDMHVQYLLKLLAHPGVLISRDDCFWNGSLTGSYTSGIS